MEFDKKHPAGTFCWTDLTTTDVKGAKAFYGKLFGWKFTDIPIGEGPDAIYAMAQIDGKDVAAMSGPMDPNDKMVAWSLYFAVASADTAAAKIKEAGGKIIAEPFDVFDSGRMLVASDPTGAVFCCWQARKHFGFGRTDEPGCVTWTEVYTPKQPKTAPFYEKVFGWKVSPMEGMSGYWLLNKPRPKTTIGGMMELTPEMKEHGVPPHWLNYFSVKDLKKSREKVEKLGGTNVSDIMEAGDFGKFSIVSDPQGGTFSMYQSLR